MLTPTETANTACELQENYRHLGYDKERVLADTQLTEQALEAALHVNKANPGDVWMLRDYLEDMLLKEGKAVYPWSRLADHSANRWFSYKTPWRT